MRLTSRSRRPSRRLCTFRTTKGRERSTRQAWLSKRAVQRPRMDGPPAVLGLLTPHPRPLSQMERVPIRFRSGLAHHVRPRVVEVGVDRAGLAARAEVVDVGRAAEWRAAKPAWAGRRTGRLAAGPAGASGPE